MTISFFKIVEIDILSLDHEIEDMDGELLSTAYDSVKWFCENGRMNFLGS